MPNMKKNGFTLTELLASIVILGVLITLATTSIINVINRVNSRNYDALMLKLEAISSSYAAETSSKLFFVQDLIDAQLIDTKDGNIHNPMNQNEILNCYPIEVTYENNSYIPQIFKENIFGEDNLSCNKDGLYNSDINLQITPIKKTATTYDIVINCKEESDLIISSNTGFYQRIEKTTGNEHTINITIKEGMQVTYTATLRLKDENIIKTRTATILN